MEPVQSADDVQNQIHQIVSEHPIVLFMKGSPDFPMCGFSGAAAQAMQSLGVPFASVNVLENEAIRQGIKVYGNWPTIPQLYVKGQLVGGSDIIRDMTASGELKKLVDEAVGS